MRLAFFFLCGLSFVFGSGCVVTDSSADCTYDTECDDGKFCNGNEICNDKGKCEPGIPYSCSPDEDDNICTENLCDEVSHQCISTKLYFKPCALVTSPDYQYDICVHGNCISPGTCDDLSCNPPGPNFHIPLEDNLTTFYEISSDHGVVKDLTTELEWKRCPQGLFGSDCSQGAAVPMSWKDALSACDELDWAGKKDWRLPSIYELRSIWRNYNIEGVCSPNIDETTFPNTPQEAFWSVSVFPPGTDQAYYVSFIHANALKSEKNSALFVRCLRGEPKTATKRFEVSLIEPTEPKPVVHDHVTGLMWQGCARGQTDKLCNGVAAVSNWSAAIDYCNNLKWAGLTGWRLPSLKELQSIFDAQQYNPAIDPNIFPNTPAGKFWSSSEYRCYTDYALPVNFLDGTSNNENPKTNTYHVRCVRNHPDGS